MIRTVKYIAMAIAALAVIAIASPLLWALGPWRSPPREPREPLDPELDWDDAGVDVDEAP